MKGYVGGLDASAFNCSYIGLVGKRRQRCGTDDQGDSFTVLRLLLFRQPKHETEMIVCIFRNTSDVRRFDVKDKHFGAFQLESLILAQNERWRQA